MYVYIYIYSVYISKSQAYLLYHIYCNSKKNYLILGTFSCYFSDCCKKMQEVVQSPSSSINASFKGLMYSSF